MVKYKRGLSHVIQGKIVHYMTQNKIDLLLLSETKINQNSKETHDDFTFIFSSEVSQEQKDKAEKLKKELIHNRKIAADDRKRQIKLGIIPKPTKEEQDEYRKQMWKENANVNFHTDGDPLGTAAIYNIPKIEKYLLDIEQHDSRNISVTLKTQIGKMTFTGTHAPHAGPKDKNLREKHTEEKHKYYDKLRKINEKYGKGPDIHYIGGDFNVRLIHSVPAEEHILGPFIHTHENATLDCLTEQQKRE